MFMIDVQNKEPIFEQISEQIIRFISIQVLLPGDKLPSVRNMAHDLGVNPNTVSKAYQELEKKGYVFSEKGKGCFISNAETGKMIVQDKLKELTSFLEELKVHHIEKSAVLDVVNNVYGRKN